jgi:hypothetical protein
MKKTIAEIMHELAKISDIGLLEDVSIDPTGFLKNNCFQLTEENLILASKSAADEAEWLRDLAWDYRGGE